MTKPEFAQGWKLLVIQPWGWRYNQLGQDGKPTVDATTQMDLYFAKLQWAHPDAWRKAVSMYVEGKEWPSIGDLLGTLKSINPQFCRAISDRTTQDYCECPAEVAEILERLKAKAMEPGQDEPVFRGVDDGQDQARVKRA